MSASSPSDAESTRLIHVASGRTAAPEAGPVSVNPPVQRGSTVLVHDARSLYTAAVSYGRLGLSTHAALSQALVELEGATAVFLLPSGAAAVSTALMAVLDAGDELLAADCVYGPTRRFCDGVLKRFGVATRYFPPRAKAPDIVGMAGPRTRAILLESPGSLTFEIQDAPAVAAMARARGVTPLIDNTCSSRSRTVSISASRP